jgi:hypothetical protein
MFGNEMISFPIGIQVGIPSQRLYLLGSFLLTIAGSP